MGVPISVTHPNPPRPSHMHHHQLRMVGMPAQVDALLARRGAHGEHEALREMKNEFMAQWDGIRPGAGGGASDRVLVLGATNRPYDLDEAVLRRFPRRVFCPLPNRAARQEILEVRPRRSHTVRHVQTTHVVNVYDDEQPGHSFHSIR